MCRSFTSLPRRGPNQVRAVLFGEAKEFPEFVYVETAPKDQEGESDQRLATLLPYFPDDGFETIDITISQIQCRVNAREQSEVLKGVYPNRLSELSQFYAENKALGRVTRLGHATIRGNSIGVRQVKDGTSNMLVYADVDMRDARNILDRLGSKRLEIPIPSVATSPWLGTAVSCVADIQTGEDRFRPIIATTDNGIYDAGVGLSIPNLLGIAVITMRYNSERPGDRPDGAVMDNPEMALLSSDINSAFILPRLDAKAQHWKSPRCTPEFQRSWVFGVTGFGSPLRIWDDSTVGSGMIFRADGKPFPMQHAEALTGFIRDEVMPKIQDAVTGLSSNDLVTKRQEVLDFITKENFENYFVKMKASRISQGLSEWSDLPFPYSMNHDINVQLPMMQDTRHQFIE